jgi:hypothetical protein
MSSFDAVVDISRKCGSCVDLNDQHSEIWGKGQFHVMDLMTSKERLNSRDFVDHSLKPLTQRIFPSGTTAAFTSQRHRDVFSPRIAFCMRHIHPIAMI